MPLWLGKDGSECSDSSGFAPQEDAIFITEESCDSCADYLRELDALRDVIEHLTMYELTDKDKREIAAIVSDMFIRTVSGTNVTINGVANTRYICGTVSSISITPPASGIIDVVFTSGTSPAILTLPSTVMMPEWFDTENLEEDRIYEINIMDGKYGTVMSWPVQ